MKIPFISRLSNLSQNISGQKSDSFDQEEMQKLLLSPPPIWSRVLIWTMSLGSFSLIIWASFTTIEETAILPGQLITLKSEIKLISPESAIVSKVNVSQHDKVNKGQSIYELSRADFEPRILNLQRKLELLSNKYNQQQNSFKIRIAQLNSQVTLNRSILERLKSLLAVGSIQEVQILEKQNELFQAEQQLQNLYSERDQSTTSYRLERNDVSNQLAELKGRTKHFDILSPSKGFMQSLGVQVKGERVQAGDLLATIVPQENLVARVQVSSRLSAPITPGKEAAITVDAFPANDFGTLTGTVSTISPTTSQPDSATQAPAYVARITINPSGIPEGYPANDLRSGMGISARVVLENKPIISIVFNFVTDLFKPMSEKK